MPQTLLALLALSMAMLFTFNSHQHFSVMQQRMMHQEIYEMGSAVATESMEIIANRMRASSDGFNENDQFGDGWNCKPFHPSGMDCEDIDDFHDVTAIRPFEINGKRFDFKVHVEVVYLSLSTNEPVPGPTDRKQVTVKVQDDWGGEAIFLEKPIALSRGFDRY